MQSNISRQINFSCRKNGYHPVIAADHLRISNHILRLKFDKRIVIQPLHHFFTAQQIRSGTLAAKYSLAAVSYSTALYKVHQSIGEKRRMDSQMFFCGQLHSQGFVERSYAKRYTASVFNYICYISGDFQENIFQRPPGDIKRGLRRFDEIVEFIHMNQSIPHDSGSMGIDLTNNNICSIHSLPFHIYSKQTGVTVFIRR